MKLVKMSLAAAVLLGASAFAIDNVKVSGDAKLFYNTNNADYGIDDNGDGTADRYQNGLFDQGASSADTALRLGVTADLVKGVSMGATAYAVSTLGLENNLVANTWTGAHSVGNGVNDEAWLGELWLAATMGKTTAKVGRMELDTPLAFSEKWSIVPNTFDAAVLINQDIPDTTLVGAWVGKGNGVNALGGAELILEDAFSFAPGTLEGAAGGYNNLSAVGLDGLMGAGAKFGTFANKGAYAAAIVNNSFKPLTAQAWYYNVLNVADAYWLQADIDCQLVKGVKIGAQYANMDPKGIVDSALNTLGLSQKDSDAYAIKLAYQGIEGLNVSAAYSETDKDGVLKIANVATNNLAAAQSKLYTEAWWNYGYVGAPGAEALNLTAEYDAGVAKVGVYFTDVDVKPTGATETLNMTEVTVTASKDFGPLNATLAYISTDADDQNTMDDTRDGKRYDSIQAYLTLNF